MTVSISHLDHLVLTVADIEESCTFYTTVLGMERVTFGQGRTALAFGSQKINLHEKGKEVEPKATHPTPGAADLCFITETPITVVVGWLAKWGVLVEEGPVYRAGASGNLLSVYFRDPDGNLLELSNQV
jgi:catechol 2,3-dioxygenase-like lactoylglutathione lyase family enzyme